MHDLPTSENGWVISPFAKVSFLEFLNLQYNLTHLSQTEFPTVINWTSPIFVVRVVGWYFTFFFSNFNRTFCEQSVKIVIRCCILWRLIWVCTVCLCPTKRMPGLYWFRSCSYKKEIAPFNSKFFPSMVTIVKMIVKMKIDEEALCLFQ